MGPKYIYIYNGGGKVNGRQEKYGKVPKRLICGYIQYHNNTFLVLPQLFILDINIILEQTKRFSLFMFVLRQHKSVKKIGGHMIS